MALLTAAEILAAEDVRLEKVSVPEWNGDVYVRNLTGRALDAYQFSLADDKGELDFTDRRAKLLARCLCDDKGKRLFNEQQIEALSGKSADVLVRLFDIAEKHNKLDKESREAIAKNSAATSDSASPTA